MKVEYYSIPSVRVKNIRDKYSLKNMSESSLCVIHFVKYKC